MTPKRSAITLHDDQTPGLVLTYDNQPFHLTGIEPYQRVDGRPSFVAVWSTDCKTCGEPMIVRSQLTDIRSPRRRCETCNPVRVVAT